MKKLFSTKKRIAAAGATVALVAAMAGGAFAYFTSSGSGSGTASTGSANTNLTVAGNAPTNMGPGVAPEEVTATITNPALDSSSYVTSLTVTISATYQTGCGTGDYGLSTTSGSAYTDNSASDTYGNGTQTITIPVGVELAPGGTKTENFYVGFVDLTNNANPNANQTGCAGQGITLNYTTA